MLRRLAAPFQGVVTTSELETAGIDRTKRRGLVSRGWLVPIRRGAYLVGAAEPAEWHRLVAAYRTAGPDAVVSHWSAARIHRLPVVGPHPGSGPPRVNLTVPGGTLRQKGDSTVFGARLDAGDVSVVRGIRVTNPARTLVDIGPDLAVGALAKLVDEGSITGLWRFTDLQQCLARAPRRRGTRDLRALVDERVSLDLGREAAGGRPDSPLEVRAIRALAACRPFETQHQIVLDARVFIVDIAWPEVRVAAECEGWAVRARSKSKFDGERRKFNQLVANGWTVVHLTAAMSDEEMRAAVIPVLLAASARRNTSAGFH